MNIVFDHKKEGKITHIIGLHREYTLCGLAIADSSINIEGFEWLRYDTPKKLNCAECIKMIKFCKEVPVSCFSKKVINPNL